MPHKKSCCKSCTKGHTCDSKKPTKGTTKQVPKYK